MPLGDFAGQSAVKHCSITFLGVHRGGGVPASLGHLLVLLRNTPWLGALRMMELLQQSSNDRVSPDALMQASKHTSPDTPGYRLDKFNVADYTVCLI